jgi:hypothetical protein
VDEVAAAQPAALAASQAAMVWVEGNTVFMLDPGKAPATLMKPSNGGLATGFLAIDTVTVLMTQASGVRRCPTTATCVSDPSAPIYGLADPGPIAIADGEMYVVERASSRRLVTCGLTANCDTSPAVVAYLPDVPKELALTTSSAVVALADQTLRAYLRAGRLDAGALQPPALATLVDVRGLAADGPDVYWADGAGGTIGRCNVDSCAASKQDLLTQRAYPRALAVSGSALYWVETNADAVLRCSLPVCSDPTVIARVLRPTDLAVGDRVYVASDTEQKIYATALR